MTWSPCLYGDREREREIMKNQNKESQKQNKIDDNNATNVFYCVAR